MENVINVAVYISQRYLSEYKQQIDEMKLHKLMYLAQRESIIQIGEPLFEATFYGWKYGPVLKEIRNLYKNKEFEKVYFSAFNSDYSSIMDRIFAEYAEKSSWSLSRLTHGELSWKNSRINVSEEENSDNPISLDDIKKDAERIKTRRRMLKELGLM